MCGPAPKPIRVNSGSARIEARIQARNERIELLKREREKEEQK